MVRKICINRSCELGNSATTFPIAKEKCPLCQSDLKLREPEKNLSDEQLQGFEEHIDELYSNFDASRVSGKGFSKYYNFLGDEWNNRGNHEKGLHFFNKSLNILINSKDSSDDEIETLYNNLGSVYQEIGQLDQAIEFYIKCLAIQKGLYDINNLSIAWTYNNIGNAFFSKLDFDSALQNYESSLNILLSLDNQDVEGLVNIYESIGNVWVSKSDLDKSISYYEQALYYYKKGLEYCNNHLSDNYTIITYYHNLIAVISMRNDEWENAILHLNKQLEISNSRLLIDPQIFSIIYWHLGICNKNISKYPSAIDFFTQALKIAPDSGGYPYEIAKCYEAINNNQEALKYYLQSVEIRLRTLGIDAKETIDSVNEYNKLAIARGDEILDLRNL